VSGPAVGDFTTRANENRTEYTGTFEVSKEGVHGSGTISFRGISEDALTVTMHESGHAPRTFELVRSHGSSEPAITLLANGKTSDSVQAGAWVALGAMQTGSIPCPDRPARITIAGSGSNGASTEARHSAPSCVQPVTNGASTWSYLATLHGNSGNVLAKSPSVTVTWSTPATG
jgi:hypothetical protein